MKKAFTITELLVAIGLLAAVLAASTMVFHYSIESQRTAMATAEIMRTLRAITDQLNADFAGLHTDGYLYLRSPVYKGNYYDAAYFFSTGIFQSWVNPNMSTDARIFWGRDPNALGVSKPLVKNLVRDAKLLTPGFSGLDYNDISYGQCKLDVNSLERLNPPGDVNNMLSIPYYPLRRPIIDMANDFNFPRRLMAQNIGDFKIEWTYGWFRTSAPGHIFWWGRDSALRAETDITEPTIPGPIQYLAPDIAQFANNINEHSLPYGVYWNPYNPKWWPKALKFTFTLYDSKGIIKGGRRFEHIVYIGQ